MEGTHLTSPQRVEQIVSLEMLKFLLINVKVMFTVYLELHILWSALHDDVSEGCIG